MQNISDFISKHVPATAVCAVILLFVFTIAISAKGNRARRSLVAKDGRLWKDRKHTFLGLPWSFTVYSMTSDRLFVKTGFFSTVENEARLYRILDVQLRQSLMQRIMGLGSIVLMSSDKTLKNFTITNVAHAREVKELISLNVERERRENRVSPREIMSGDSDSDSDTDEDNEI